MTPKMSDDGYLWILPDSPRIKYAWVAWKEKNSDDFERGEVIWQGTSKKAAWGFIRANKHKFHPYGLLREARLYLTRPSAAVIA